MRGQVLVLGAVLLVAILMSLIAIAYVWGKPLIDKQTSVVDYTYAQSKLIEMRDAISVVSREEGRQETVDADLRRMSLNIIEGDPYDGEEPGKNSIDFRMDFDLLESDSWATISPDEDLLTTGDVGRDMPGVIVAKTDGDETLIRLWYRDLYDEKGREYYRIELSRKTPWVLESGREMLLIKNIGQYREGNKVITKVEVSGI